MKKEKKNNASKTAAKSKVKKAVKCNQRECVDRHCELRDTITAYVEVDTRLECKLRKACQVRGLAFPDGLSMLLKEVCTPCRATVNGKAKVKAK